jgi:hypothetical protein
MAKVIAPFQIEGTLNDLNFYIDQEGTNRVRMKPEAKMTTHKFKTLPSYHKVRMHSKEFGQCATIAKTFRVLAVHFNRNAKDGSFAGRVNKLLFEILQEDTQNELGSRLFKEGIKTRFGQELLLGFESNKLRPLTQVLKNKKWEIKKYIFNFPNCVPDTDIDWPEEATHVSFNLAIANWNTENNSFSTNYGTPVIFSKTDAPQNITLECLSPIEQDLHITFLFIGFSKQRGSHHLPLHRKYNTASIINYHFHDLTL